ncbi:unnamed protein product [Trichobilharzia szidati]|nr:unnamed protein product [Trichobilharzia szidati]
MDSISAVHMKIYRSAQQCGSLNLADRGLQSVPSIVWELNTPLPCEQRDQTVNFENTAGDDCRWWETQPITKLNLATNQLTTIEGGINKLDTLTHLDLHDNQLLGLPDEIGDLVNLRTLLLSYNQLKKLPTSISKLQNLIILDLANNQLESLDENIANLNYLERLDLSKNALTSLPSKLPPQLRQLTVHHNRLKKVTDGLIENLKLLKILDLSSNQIEELILDKGPSNNRSKFQLSVLHVEMNRLTRLPDVAGLNELKELHLSDNRITTVDLTCLQGSSITVLDLARNCIKQLPEGIPKCLPNLSRLDISSNELTSIPTELGFMDSLLVLFISCNPIRSIRQSIITGSTEAIKSLLRQRHRPEDNSEPCQPISTNSTNAQVKTVDNNNNANTSESLQSVNIPKNNNYNMNGTTGSIPSKTNKPSITVDHCDIQLPPVGPSGNLEWSGKTAQKSISAAQLPPLDSPTEWIQAATLPKSQTNPVVKSLCLTHRFLHQFPQGIFAFATSLRELNMSCNHIAELPENFDQLSKLENLNLSSNQLKHLPECLSNLSELKTLCLDSNPLGPELQCNIVLKSPLVNKLEYLSLRGCQLKVCPTPEYLSQANAPNLSTLDLTNNDIDQLPAELGLCTQIRSLLLQGNTFRIPRPAIVAKGTEAILSYLRSRIPES